MWPIPFAFSCAAAADGEEGFFPTEWYPAWIHITLHIEQIYPSLYFNCYSPGSRSALQGTGMPQSTMPP